MFTTGQRVGVAVSGGADSVCLLHLLHELGPRWNLHLSVVHVEHGIRGPDSRADAEFAAGLAAQLDLRFHFRAVDVPAIEDNLEQAARNARLAFFHDLVAAGTLDRIATGHTRSDQAETVLYRLLRGSGLTGLCGVLPVTGAGLVRPLLDCTRLEIETWLRERNIPWREDVTNADPTYARNRLRHEVLPLLRQSFNPQLDEALARIATLAQDEEAFWRGYLPPPPTRVPALLSVPELCACPPAAARRRIRKVLEFVKGDLRQIDFDHVETIVEMAHSVQGSGRVQLPGLDIFRSFDWIRVTPARYDAGRPRNFRFSVSVPGEVAIPDGEATVNFALIDAASGTALHDKLVSELDWQRLTFISPPDAGLELRNWRPGDQYRRLGEHKSEKLKLLFQFARVPLWERRNWPVLVRGEEILWSRSFGPAAEFAAAEGTGLRLRIWETHRE